MVTATPLIPVTLYDLLQFPESRSVFPWMPWWNWWTYWTTLGISTGFEAFHGLAAVWVLGRADTERPAPKKAVASLFGIAFLATFIPVLFWPAIEYSLAWGLTNGLIVFLVWRYDAVKQALSRAAEPCKRYWEGDFG